MGNVFDSEGYRAWKETLIEILGETAATLVERKVIEKLSQKKLVIDDV